MFSRRISSILIWSLVLLATLIIIARNALKVETVFRAGIEDPILGGCISDTFLSTAYMIQEHYNKTGSLPSNWHELSVMSFIIGDIKLIKLSDYVIQFIENLGVDHVFLLPGGGCMHLLDSVGKSRKVNYVCNLHEQAAAIAADAYSQYTNHIGVALVTTGPGGTNAITGVSASWLDSIPVMILSGQVKTSDLAKGRGIRQMGFQEIDIISLVKPITKYACMVTDPETIK